MQNAVSAAQQEANLRLVKEQQAAKLELEKALQSTEMEGFKAKQTTELETKRLRRAAVKEIKKEAASCETTSSRKGWRNQPIKALIAETISVLSR